MTTEASKSDSLTALLTQLAHDLEALPGKIAAQVAAQVVAALKPKDVATILVGGKELPVLSLDATGDDDSFFEVSFTVVVSEHADLLRAGSTVKICFNGDPVFTGRLLSRKPEGDTIICRAASSVTADPPLWERHKDAHGQLQPPKTLPFVEKTTQAD